MTKDTVTINKSELAKMQRQIAKLNALEAGGVDNWEWYGESLDEWNKENELDELYENAVHELHDRLVDAEVDEPAGRGCGYSIALDDENCIEFFKWLIAEYKKIDGGE